MASTSFSADGAFGYDGVKCDHVNFSHFQVVEQYFNTIYVSCDAKMKSENEYRKHYSTGFN